MEIQDPITRSKRRASLVPAAAVIPALLAYTNAVAVKRLVVGFRGPGRSLSDVRLVGKNLSRKRSSRDGRTVIWKRDRSDEEGVY